jgi:hypothetical protein
MSTMPKKRQRGARRSEPNGNGQQPRTARANHVDGNTEFLRAFADALRDILLEERHRAA